MKTPDFYMTSCDVYEWDEMSRVRNCWRIKRIAIGVRDDCLLIRIDPPIRDGANHGLKNIDLSLVLMATRHRDQSFFPIDQWPTFVYVSALLVDDPSLRDQFRPEESRSIGWAELYRTEEDAQQQRRKSHWGLRFLEEENGIEIGDLKSRLGALLVNNSGIKRAYLVKVGYEGHSISRSALCLWLEHDLDSRITEGLQRIIEWAATALQLPILSLLLDDDEEAKLAKVCTPFVNNALP